MAITNRKSTGFQNIAFPRKTLDQREIFCELIAAEVRCGRLTPMRRARIVRFASQLGLSATEAGQMIAQCKRMASAGDAELSEAWIPRLQPRVSRPVRLSPSVAIVTGVLLLVIWILR